MYPIVSLVFFVALTGCHHVGYSEWKSAKPGPELRERIVSQAKKQLGKTHVTVLGRPFRSDCSGFVRAVFIQAASPLLITPRPHENDVAAIYRFLREKGMLHKKRPLPGDFIFFRNTYDKNKDGVLQDDLTHIGIVEAVRQDQTVLFIHYLNDQVVRSRMNLKYPRLRFHPHSGARVNNILRQATLGRQRATMGELFVEFAQAPQLSG